MKKIWLLKVLGICLCVCVSIFLFTTYLQASYVELECSDIDYDEAQYIKFIIDADINFDIVLYMKDNDNNSFKVRYQTENDLDTGDYKDDDDNDVLTIFLDEDEYVTGHDETFNSFTYGNSFSLEEYINTHWQKREYNGGSAKLEKIRIKGNEFKLYYIAIDDGDFSDPTWELDVSDENWDDLNDFENDGHSIPDLDEYSTYTTDIAFLGDYIHLTIDHLPGVGYLPSPYWWNQPYNYGWNQPYFGGYQQAYNPYGYQQQPYSYGWNQPSYGWDNYNYMYPSNYNPYSYSWNQPSYGYGWNQPSYGWDGYNYPYNYNPYSSNPYNYGYQYSPGPLGGVYRISPGGQTRLIRPDGTGVEIGPYAY